MRRPPSLAALVAALPLAACFSGSPVPTESTAAQSATVEAASNGTVFSPATVTIVKGGSVTWTFGTFTHNVTFVSAPNAPANIPTTRNTSVTRQFPASGTFTYACTLHAGMVGSVVVQ